jgi:hypothetical protein
LQGFQADDEKGIMHQLVRGKIVYQ